MRPIKREYAGPRTNGGSQATARSWLQQHIADFPDYEWKIIPINFLPEMSGRKRYKLVGYLRGTLASCSVVKEIEVNGRTVKATFPSEPTPAMEAAMVAHLQELEASWTPAVVVPRGYKPPNRAKQIRTAIRTKNNV